MTTNRLAGEKSPYLLQHAHNPVDWYPWGEEAFAKAKRENKPIFLSIGYATCHWCHVMERESFENDAIAKLLRDSFVSIKVDREERPDVDEIYMAAVLAMNRGRGGWPLSAFLTPEGRPFFTGTYFPPEDRGGMPGFARLLEMIAAEWKQRPEALREGADQVTDFLRETAQAPGGGRGAPPADAVLGHALTVYRSEFDPTWGGFGPAPKFPRSMAVELLLRIHRATGDESALRMATLTLDRMADGGMYDHLGGGFARYSTDARWLVPHFEKMLYDNALLARAYLDGHLVTGEGRYARVAAEILEYVLRDMTRDGGGFFSAEDADSEGEEGTFYVWTPDQIEAVLGADDAKTFAACYGVTAGGNFEHGASVLHVARPFAEVAQEQGLALGELEARLASARAKLLATRETRERPLRDDKVLAGWNGLMISAMAQGYRVLGDDRYLAAALAAASFLLDRMIAGGVLMRRFREGEAAHRGVLEDHAALIAALLDLLETTGEPRWMEAALALAGETERRFADASGAYFTAPNDGEELIARRIDPQDGALPSGTSLMAMNLGRLAALTGDDAYRDRAERIFAVFREAIVRTPHAFPYLLGALDVHHAAPCEVVVAGDADAEETRAMLRAAWRRFGPNRVVVPVLGDAPARAKLAELVPIVAGREPADGAPTAWVCVGRTCGLPAKSAVELAARLDAAGAGES